MSPTLIAILLTVFLALAAVAGDYFLKVASKSTSPFLNWNFLLGLLIYGLSAFGWVAIMPNLKLAYIGVVFCLTMVLCLCFVGLFAFDESLTGREWLGVCLALISLVLLYRVA
jgi:drug/metabolite transporter (DMT)-like permease